jgi:hypothetical protein
MTGTIHPRKPYNFLRRFSAKKKQRAAKGSATSICLEKTRAKEPIEPHVRSALDWDSTYLKKYRREKISKKRLKLIV